MRHWSVKSTNATGRSNRRRPVAGPATEAATGRPCREIHNMAQPSEALLVGPAGHAFEGGGADFALVGFPKEEDVPEVDDGADAGAEKQECSLVDAKFK